MLSENFRLSRPVGTGHSRPNDVIRLRKALNETGHAASPRPRSGQYNAAAIAAIERFQRDFGLETDGVVLPGGPTERVLDMALEARRQGGADAMAQMRDAFAALGARGLVFHPNPHGEETPGLFADRSGRPVPSERLLRVLAGSSVPGGADRSDSDRFAMNLRTADGRKRTGRRRPPGTRPGEKQVAAVPLVPAIGAVLAEAAPEIAAILGVVGGAAIGQEVIDAARRKGSQPPPPATGRPVRRSVPLDNPPRGTPPFPAEPPEELKPTPEKIRAEPAEPAIQKGPEIEEARPGVFIFPDLSGELDDFMIVEDRRGNERTRAGLEKVRDYFLGTVFGGNPDWKLFAGGRDPKTGEEKREEWIQGPQKDFEPLLGIKIDGRKGGKFVDLTFKNHRTGEIVRVQTVDGDKHGKPTQRELDNAEIIRKRARGKLYLIVKDSIPE